MRSVWPLEAREFLLRAAALVVAIGVETRGACARCCAACISVGACAVQPREEQEKLQQLVPHEVAASQVALAGVVRAPRDCDVRSDPPTAGARRASIVQHSAVTDRWLGPRSLSLRDSAFS